MGMGLGTPGLPLLPSLLPLLLLVLAVEVLLTEAMEETMMIDDDVDGEKD